MMGLLQAILWNGMFKNVQHSPISFILEFRVFLTNMSNIIPIMDLMMVSINYLRPAQHFKGLLTF